MHALRGVQRSGRSGWPARVLLGLSVLWTPPALMAEERPPVVWGQGLVRCGEFLATAPESDSASAPLVIQSREYQLMREWLAGFISGLSLATGEDRLRGAELDAAFEQIRHHCRSRPEEDVLSVTLDWLRSLSQTDVER